MVGIYISIRFEPKMAAAAFVAMVHDILVTVGVYSLFNFQVTPDTVVAVLTILGYSLYDTVVVFDRVRDNTKGIGATGRVTYTQLINLSMNQTLARSINTSLVAILPVLAVLVVGAELLGASTLQDFGLALFVGLFERGLLVDLHRRSGALHVERAGVALDCHRATQCQAHRPRRLAVAGGSGGSGHADEHLGRRADPQRAPDPSGARRAAPSDRGRASSTAVLDRRPGSGAAGDRVGCRHRSSPGATTTPEEQRQAPALGQRARATRQR